MSADVMMRRLCQRCGDPRPSGRKFCVPCTERVTAAVKAAAKARKPRAICSRCGTQPKRPGRGQLYCSACATIVAEEAAAKALVLFVRDENSPPYKHAPNPCILCGGPKARGRARRTCIPCQPLVREATRVSRHPATIERRCRRCQVIKPTDAFDLVLSPGAPKSSPQLKVCRECHVLPPATPERKPCRRCGTQPKQGGRGQNFCAYCQVIVHEEARITKMWRIRATSKTLSRKYVWERDRATCGICHRLIESLSDFHVDHIIPLSKGGEHSYQNLQAAHARCNQRKSDAYE